MTMREPKSGRAFDGRGALAVIPGRALRMILVGPAGATVLDAWMTPERWRVSVPPTRLLARGGAEEPPDLPVGFLRWLFFRPLEGTLFGGSQRTGETVFLLRDGAAVVTDRIGPCDLGHRAIITRRAEGRSEVIDACRASAGTPHAGDRVRYENETTGLHVDLLLESVSPSLPSPDAFLDPDGPPPSFTVDAGVPIGGAPP